jgi:hypothetical protein
MAQGSVGRGWSLVWRHSRILGWVFAINLLLGLASTTVPRVEFQKLLDHSLVSDRLVNGFDAGVLIEAIMKPDINIRALAQGSVPFAYLFFFFMLFITGGILAAYREDRRLTTGEFFEASGGYFWRMVRIFLFSLVPLGVIGIVFAIILGISSQIDNEQTAFYVRLSGIILCVILVLLVRLWFDVAQVRAVAQNEHGMFHNVMRALVISLKALGSLLWIYLCISIVGWIVLALGLWLWSKVPGNHFGISWLVLELVMLSQLFTRLWQRAASVSWYGLYAEEHLAAAVEFTTPQPIEIPEPPAMPPIVPPPAESS